MIAPRLARTLALQIAAMMLLPYAMDAAPRRDRSIVLSTQTLTFSATEGGAMPGAQTVTLSNGGNHSMNWQASVDRTWLSVSPSSGTLQGFGSVLLTVSPVGTPQAERWTAINSIGAPQAREDHDAVWTGSRMVLWGGEFSGTNLNTGGLYDPAANAWVGPTTLTGAPSPRTLHTLTWTGNRVIVWGGATGPGDISNTTFFKEGHRYDPVANKWMGKIATSNSPSARAWHSAVWTGSRMIVWGGYDGTNRLNTGGIYDPVANRWENATSTVNAPSPRLHHSACWTGTEMIIWGGQDANLSDRNDGARYNPVTDAWTPVTMVGAPSPRPAHTAIWSGWEMIVWGGSVAVPGGSASTQGGGRYDPGTDTWTGTTTLTGAPSPRQSHSAVWNGSKMIVTHGAVQGGGYKDDGASYEPPVAPPGSHLAKITVSAQGALNSPSVISATLSVTPPLAPTLRVSNVSPAPGSNLAGATQIVASLNGAVDPASIDSSSVRLVRAGPDGLFGTADDVVLAPGLSVVGTNQLKLNLAGLTLPNDQYRLTLSGSPGAASGLYARWRFDEGSGAAAIDSSGNGRHGGIDNVQWAAGRVGFGLHFEGGPNRVNLNLGNLPTPWTAALWVRREDSPNSESRVTDSSSGATSLRLEQFNPPNRVGFTQYAVEDYFFDFIAPEGSWVHLTWVGSGTGTSLYVNGAFQQTHPASIFLSLDQLGTSSVNALKGSMDDVQIYTRALAASEILAIASLAGTVRDAGGEVLDGDFSGPFPSGNGASGGDFVAGFTVSP